jgi:lysyl endopeptidase
MRFITLRTVILSGFVLVTSLALAQITRPGNPLPLNYPGLKNVAVYDLAVPEENRRQGPVTSEGPRLKPAGSGTEIEVDYTAQNSGTWDTLADGMRIWRIAFRVQGARLLNLVLTNFRVETGVKIFIYDPGQQDVLGAYSDLNNKYTRVLATGYLPGEMLILEVQEPFFVKAACSLHVTGIGCDFAENQGQHPFKDGWFGLSGSCNVDINCDPSESIQKVKNAVIRIVFQGDERCTGTLLNNTRQDGRSYVLTAQHCINTEDVANKAVFYFMYESPHCNGPDGSNSRSASGATIRATSSNMDFTLLELLEPLPVQYHPYFAGWDNTAVIPASTYSIHHPLGDVKKISIENNPVTISSFGGKYDRNKHWLVPRWTSGTTEAGSSGGGLFDANNRVRGSLTGGEAVCGNPVNDYFQMFSHDWKDYPAINNQLAYWLDPVNTKATGMDGFDPYADFWKSGDTLSNIRPGEEVKPYQSGLAWGAWSGHNSGHITQFAEHFINNQKQKVMGTLLNVDRNYVGSASSSLVVKIWTDQGQPATVVYQKNVLLADLASGTVQFIEFDSAVTIGSSFFAGYELFYHTPADTFSTDMAQNRLTDSVNTAYVFDNQWYELSKYSSGAIYSSFSIRPVVFDSVPHLKSVEYSTPIMLYPNPARGYCWIEFKRLIELPVHVTISDLQGNKLSDTDYGPYQRSVRLEISNFKPGIYLIRVKQGGNFYTAKLVIIR